MFADLDEEQRELLRVLRSFHDVLLLNEDDSLQMYQTRLRSLYRLGMINLSLPSFSLPGDGSSVSNLLRKQRSLVARLREANSRYDRAVKTAEYYRCNWEKCSAELQDNQFMLRQAHARFEEFKASHSDWTAPEDVELDADLDEEAVKIFQHVDADLDVAQQLKYDGSGFLTTFWHQQREMLKAPSARARRWNPQVRRTMNS